MLDSFVASELGVRRFMEIPLERIENSEALISVFGYWPSFHDAEVLELLIQRNGSSSGCASIVALVHVFEMTNQIKSDGHFLCHKHSIVSFAFEDIDELTLDSFNYQNVLDCLSIEEMESGSFAVTFDSAYGLDAFFTCRHIKVKSVIQGIPAKSVYSAEKT